MNNIKLIFLFYILFCIIYAGTIFSQSSYDEISKIESLVSDKQYFSGLSLCRSILNECTQQATDKCWYTNFMKDIYRLKGICEYEIYQNDLDASRLQSSIQSFKQSYSLYNDPELLYLYGYLSAYQNVLIGNYLDLSGIIDAWTGILKLYEQNNWTVTPEIVQKTISYLKICERYDIVIPSKNYFGNFARFMIINACNLIDKGNLPLTDYNLIVTIKKKYQK
jgi:hypothetical protein